MFPLLLSSCASNSNLRPCTMVKAVADRNGHNVGQCLVRWALQRRPVGLSTCCVLGFRVQGLGSRAQGLWLTYGWRGAALQCRPVELSTCYMFHTTQNDTCWLKSTNSAYW